MSTPVLEPTQHEVMPPFPHPEAKTEGCPDGMVRVTGEYCLGVVQTCLSHHEEYLKRRGSETVSERCLEYIAPSRCREEKRQRMDFCVDRYEYPNQLGELPWVLTSWRQARRLCTEQGKRLCTEEEFNFACEGPDIYPYATGFVRDPDKCNIDKSYRKPDHSMVMLTYENCLEDDACRAEFERLDQRHAIGANLACVSWAGVVDMNGNVNEWIERVGQEPPHRSGLKGGWWGPVRNRCRPTVRFHKEFDYGYEAGFRCCKGFDEEERVDRFDQPQHNVSPEDLEKPSKTKAIKTDTPGDEPRSAPAAAEPPHSASTAPAQPPKTRRPKPAPSAKEPPPNGPTAPIVAPVDGPVVEPAGDGAH